MSIKNELDVIGQTWIPQNASKVRQAIHDILIKTYDTASENGNANMEVEIARGTHPNLRSRLEEVDNKQKQTASKLVQTEYEAKRKRKLEDLEPEVLSAIEGGEGTSFNLLSEPQDESVTGYKTVDTSVASKTKNLFAKRSVQKGGYLSASTGNFIENSDYTISDFIPVEQSTIYRKNYDGSIVFYDAGRNFISGLAPTQNFTTPNNAHFVRTSLDSNVLDSAMLSLRTEWSSSYEPYLPEYKLGKLGMCQIQAYANTLSQETH